MDISRLLVDAIDRLGMCFVARVLGPTMTMTHRKLLEEEKKKLHEPQIPSKANERTNEPLVNDVTCS